MISDKDGDYGIIPTTVEAKVAKSILRYLEQQGECDYNAALPSVVDFVASEFHHDAADYKNNLMFEISGIGAFCTYKDEE